LYYKFAHRHVPVGENFVDLERMARIVRGKHGCGARRKAQHRQEYQYDDLQLRAPAHIPTPPHAPVT
jgi:hypothetical protein